MSRYGSPSPPALRPFLRGLVQTTAMSAPAALKDFTPVGQAMTVEFVFFKPVDLTAFTIRCVKWDAAIGAAIEVKATAYASQGAAAKHVSIEFSANTDPVAVYVTDLTGTPASTFMFWWRPVT